MHKATDQDPDLEFYLTQAESTHGARGTLASTINQLECGGPNEGGKLGEDGMYIHPYTDLQLGTGRCTRGDIERCRWLASAWFACSVDTRALLLARHLAPRAMFRSDEGYGARDRHVEGADGKAGRHGATRTGIESQLGELANVALAVYGKPNEVEAQPGADPEVTKAAQDAAEAEANRRLAELIVACHEFNGQADPEPGKPAPMVSGKQAAHGRTIRRARRAAEKALAPAWAEWFAAKSAADPMRANVERNPSWKPADAVPLDNPPAPSADSVRAELTRLLRGYAPVAAE